MTSSSRMISMNITSSSSSLEQKIFVLEDWGTNSSDSSIEFSFCTVLWRWKLTISVCGLELVFLGFALILLILRQSINLGSFGLLGMDCDGVD
ncbi:hypothetical protein Tco_0010666 [Tanacetum coccineum]